MLSGRETTFQAVSKSLVFSPPLCDNNVNYPIRQHQSLQISSSFEAYTNYCLLIPSRFSYYFVKANVDFISEGSGGLWWRILMHLYMFEEREIIISDRIKISAKHSVLVQNWNCGELLCAEQELVLVFY